MASCYRLSAAAFVLGIVAPGAGLAQAPEFVYPVGDPTIRPHPGISSLAENGYRVIQGFRNDIGHTGVDLANGEVGGEVRAVYEGIVTEVRRDPRAGLGTLVRIRHLVPHYGTIFTQYAHLNVDSIRVAEGHTVTSGEVLGTVDCTGYTNGQTGCPGHDNPGPHLHFSFQWTDQAGCGYVPTRGCTDKAEEFDDLYPEMDPLAIIDAQRNPVDAPVTLYSTFGPGGTFQRDFYDISKEAVANGFTVERPTRLAEVQFAVTVPTVLKRVVHVAVMSGPVPEALVEEWYVDVRPTNPAIPELPSIRVVSSVTHPSLSANTQYWLVLNDAKPVGTDPELGIGWNFATAVGGQVLYLSPGLPWLASPYPVSAFAIAGTP